MVKRFVPRLACIGAMLTVAALSAGAQGLTGAIDGTVRDETGAVLPGVTVTVLSPSLLGGPQARTSDGAGLFRFTLLPPGEYVLTLELSGFQSIQVQALVVQADRTLTIDRVMKPATVAENVTVVGASPLVDVRSTQVATTLSRDTIEAMPVSRRFSDLLNVMPGVQNGLYTFSPINAVYGSKVTDNVYSVDGVNFVDPAVSSPVTDIPYDDIQEVQVSTSGQFAEFGSASGGVFNFITKSGGNRFSGLASAYVQDEAVTSDNISSELAAQGILPSAFDYIRDVGGNAGGPVARDRLWFFGSYYRQNQAQSASDFPVPKETRQWQSTGKIDGQVNASNRFGVFYNYRDRSFFPFVNSNVATAGDPRTWKEIGWQNHLLGVNWSYLPDERTVVQVRGGTALFDLINRRPNLVPGTPVITEQTTGFITGGPPTTSGLMQRDRYELRADVSRFVPALLGGSHELKGGVGYERLKIDAEGVDEAQASDLRLQTLNGNAYRVQLLSVEGHARTTIPHWSAYVQDQWTAGAVTVNAGVRFDRWGADLGPDEWTGGTWFEPQTIAKQTSTLSLSNVAPRIGAAWDVGSRQIWALKAAYGRFYQRVDGAIAGVSRVGRTGTVTYDWIDRNGDLRYQPGEEGTLRSDSRPVTSGRIDPDLKMPYTDSFNIGIERQLPWAMSVAVNGVFKRERNLWNRIDEARPLDTAYDRVDVQNPLSGQTLTIFSVKPEFQGLPPLQVLTNPRNPVKLYRDYNGLEFVLKRRMQNRWTTQASYNLGRSHGTVGTLFFDHQGSPYLNPNNLIFVDGDQQLDRRHMLKVFAQAQLPWGVQLGGRVQFLSGVPLYTNTSGGQGVTGARFVRFTRQDYPGIRTSAFLDIPGEDQGTLRLDAETTVDLRLDKRVQLGKTSLDVMVDVFNLLNANTIVRVQSLNTAQANFLRAAEILTPRAARLGLRLNF